MIGLFSLTDFFDPKCSGVSIRLWQPFLVISRCNAFLTKIDLFQVGVFDKHVFYDVFIHLEAKKESVFRFLKGCSSDKYYLLNSSDLQESDARFGLEIES